MIQTVTNLNDLTFFPDNPRQSVRDEYIESLAESIKHKGVLIPLLTRDDPQLPGKMQVIAGACRLKASMLLENLGQLPQRFSISVQHLGHISDQEAFEIAVTENLQRADMDEHQKITAIARVATSRGVQGAADKLGLKLPQVKQALDISLAEPALLEALQQERINLGQAHQLSLLPREMQLDFLEQAINHQWDSKELKEASKAQLIPLSAARFAVSKYKKGFTDPLFSDEPCFMDKKEFLRLQLQWLEEEKGRRTGHLFVATGKIPEGYERVLDVQNTPRETCGLVLSVDMNSGEVTERLVQKKREVLLQESPKTVKRNQRPVVLGGQRKVLRLHQQLVDQHRLTLVVLVHHLLTQESLKIPDSSGMYSLHPLVKQAREKLVAELAEQGLPVGLNPKDHTLQVVPAVDSHEVLFQALRSLGQGDLLKVLSALTLQTLSHPDRKVFQLLAETQGLSDAFDGNWEVYLGTLDRDELVSFIEKHHLAVQVHPEQSKKDIVNMLLENKLQLSVVVPEEFKY